MLTNLPINKNVQEVMHLLEPSRRRVHVQKLWREKKGMK